MKKEPVLKISRRRLFSLWKKESLQWLRNPLLLIIFLTTTTVQVVIFGQSVSTQPSHLPVMILNQDQSPTSRDLIQQIEAGTTFNVQEVREEEPLSKALKKGNIEMAVMIPPDFTETLVKKGALKLKVYLDGAQANTAHLAKAYFLLRLREFYGSLRHSNFPLKDLSPSLSEGPLDLQYQILYNRDLKDSFFMVPGMVGTVILLIVTALSAISFTREKEIGTMTGVQMSPISPLEFILGKAVPLFLFSFFFSFLGFFTGCLWFHIPLTGSVLLLIFSTIFFLIICIEFGFLTACFSRNQLQACMTTLFFTIPGIFLSGALNQIDVWWPPFLRFLSSLNPLFYYVKLSQGIFIAETGWSSGWPLLVALLLFMGLGTVLTLSFSRRFFIESSWRE